MVLSWSAPLGAPWAVVPSRPEALCADAIDATPIEDARQRAALNTIAQEMVLNGLIVPAKWRSVCHPSQAPHPTPMPKRTSPPYRDNVATLSGRGTPTSHTHMRAPPAHHAALPAIPVLFLTQKNVHACLVTGHFDARFS